MSLAHHLISACWHFSSTVRYDYRKIRMSSSLWLSWQPVITHWLGRSRRLWSYVSTRWGGWHTPPVFILSHVKHVCSYNYKNSITVKKSMLYPATRNSAHLSMALLSLTVKVGKPEHNGCFWQLKSFVLAAGEHNNQLGGESSNTYEEAMTVILSKMIASELW